MKCLERNPAKRMTVNDIIKFQDSLEMVNFGSSMSRIKFEMLLAKTKVKNEVVKRAHYDKKYVDYTSKSLDLRNNPWFFSKSYSYDNRPKDGIYTFKKEATPKDAIQNKT